MEAEQKGPGLDPAWLDIPDPLLRPAEPRSSPAVAPAAESPTRSQVRWQRLVALAACVVWPAIVLMRSGFRRPFEGSFLVPQTLVWAALLILTAWASVSSGRRGLGRPVRLAELLAIGAPAAFVVLGLFWLPGQAPNRFGEIGPIALVPNCVALGLSVAIPMLVASAWSLMRSFPTGASWRGAALGAACGLGAALVLTLHCGSQFGGHIALAHGGPLALTTLAGAIFGSKLGRT